MKLRVLKDYVNHRLGLEYKAGEVLEDVVESMVQYLLQDTEHFEEYHEEKKAPEGPPADKAVKAPGRKK